MDEVVNDTDVAEQKQEVKSLITLGKADRMLEEVISVDDAKKLVNLAEAARVYAKQIDLGLSAQNHAAEIKIRAQRRGGEILATMERAKLGERTEHSSSIPLTIKNDSKPPTLADMGINKTESSTWQAIASIPEEKFESFIHDVQDEEKELTTTATIKVAKQYKAKEKAEATALPSDKYRVLYADPPWKYSDTLVDGYGPAEFHYPTMTIEELCALPIAEIAEKDSVMFLWVTSPLLEDAFEVVDAWGFEYKTSFVWDKVKHNYGHYNSVRHEFLLVCTRGSCVPDSKNLVDSVQTIERTKEHSEKPEEFRNIIETLYTNGNKIELFARKECEGWDKWGNEPDLKKD